MTAHEPAEGQISHAGLAHAWLDWGGSGQPLIMLHPNGFCAGVYHPIAQRLRDQFRIIGVDLRGQGASEKVTEEALLGNDAMAQDILAIADHLGLNSFSLLGVSLGGGVAIEIAAAAPQRVQKMLLIEAIAFSGPDRESQHFDYGTGNHPLAIGARKRRAVWEDRSTVVASYGARRPLNVLDPKVLEAYARWGFVDRPDGQIELACDPETEALIFDSHRNHGPKETFDQLASITTSTTVLHGTHSDLSPAWFEEQAQQLGTTAQAIEGSHFFFFENLERAEELVRQHLT
ncbi:MAG: alpha/beta hydrolase [Actinobacteria bacterium]|jgi:pimeloyl-ACP methyl ester carboxylesterase|nr:alpha/beta hydrolase [Actinomycetota bacterium]MBT3746601.1 alpha/beta hydrolase [Actinomycetota bacterium]MBT3969141.1 alpha/beta hydrolase [Actinomycetota bacterium]MBT4010055.1 alpha/beta hydrolase [Actinomycetota bacterium]MBT4476759.1 alpha/beta hydrolase [Actinomycetota bacterium]